MYHCSALLDIIDIVFQITVIHHQTQTTLGQLCDVEIDTHVTLLRIIDIYKSPSVLLAIIIIIDILECRGVTGELKCHSLIS